MIRLVIQGAQVHDIASFYAEINRVFMQAEDWQLGASLDAFDDLLRGGYGAMAGHEAALLVWRDLDHSRAALGVQATRDWYLAKLAQPRTFDATRLTADLAALDAGTGPTYFQMLLDIIADHPRITLIAD